MTNPFKIFKIKHEERIMALIAFLAITTMNVLCIMKYFDRFSQISDNYKMLFVRVFHISGFDPISYWVVSNWTTGYNIYRHPLLAFFMYIPNQINQGLMIATGMNWVQFIMAVILIFCSFYAFIFFYRILREVVQLKRIDSTVLSFFLYSFAYIIIASFVPDHFIMSMFMLMLTLYVAGKKIVNKKPFTKWQTILFFIITAGISLNNGVKVFLANFFVNGKKFWHPANLLLAIIIPSALMWGTARLEWNYFEKPAFLHRQELRAKKAEKEKQQLIAAFKDTTSIKDTTLQNAAIEKLLLQKKQQKAEKKSKKAMYAHTGKPINKTEFGQWTDITTPRWDSLVENVFGESIQLHQDHFLQDVLTKRPVIVRYRWCGSYVVEALIMLFFVLGIWFGRKSRFFWLAFSFFAFDMLIHVVLGFGLNEAYIMSPHYLFMVPLGIAYLMKSLRGAPHIALRLTLLVMTIYLYAYNATLLVNFLVG